MALLLVGAVAFLMPLLSVPAGAEPPVEVLEAATNGVYIAPGRAFESAELSAVVETARARGIDMFIAAPADPEPDAAAYALRLRQAGEFDVALVFGLEGEPRGSVTDDYDDGFARAQKAAAAAASPGQAADAFVAELMRTSPGGLPDIVKDIARYVMILAVVIGLASAAEIALRSRRRRGRVDVETTA